MKRWLALFALLGILTLGTVAIGPRVAGAERRFDSIQPGMSRAEVVALLGKPEQDIAGTDVTLLAWPHQG